MSRRGRVKWTEDFADSGRSVRGPHGKSTEVGDSRKVEKIVGKTGASVKRHRRFKMSGRWHVIYRRAHCILIYLLVLRANSANWGWR